jgi:hypothetical protein
MKYLVIALFFSSSAFAQSATDSLYIITYTVGKAWDQSKKPNEQSYFKEHSALMGKLMKDGITKFGARYSDKGMIIISVASLQAAKEIILNDVAVINNLFIADIQKLNIFFNSYTAKPK